MSDTEENLKNRCAAIVSEVFEIPHSNDRSHTQKRRTLKRKLIDKAVTDYPGKRMDIEAYVHKFGEERKRKLLAPHRRWFSNVHSLR